jgi:polar amino acid transport system substrate-binding protein
MSLRAISARLLVVLALFLGLSSGVQAQTRDMPKVVTVGVYVNPPFVIKRGNDYEGLAFELWQDMARREHLVAHYVDYPTPKALLAATEAHEVDIAIGNLTITRDRSEKVDFTFPWHDGGLRIMTDGEVHSGISDLFSALGSAGYLRAYFWLCIVIVGATILLTLFDRRFDKDFPRKWLPGLAESFYHVMSIATTGRTSRKHMFGSFGRLFSAFWLICGVAVLAYVTSSVTSVMTVAAVTDQIETIDDLKDKTVGVLDGGASEAYATSIGLAIRAYPNLDAGIAALRADDIDAMIGDDTVLEYQVHDVASPGLKVVGPVFNPEKYGFATALGSPLTRAISLDLMSAHEDGTSKTLGDKYLGAEL